MVCLFQQQGLDHSSGILLCHKYVSGVVISNPQPSSQFWHPCVSSVCKWCGYFNSKAWLTVLASCVPSESKWCSDFNHKAWLTVLTSLHAIRLYVVWLFQSSSLAHSSGILVCHQRVSGVVISTKKPGSWF